MKKPSAFDLWFGLLGQFIMFFVGFTGVFQTVNALNTKSPEVHTLWFCIAFFLVFAFTFFSLILGVMQAVDYIIKMNKYEDYEESQKKGKQL